MFSKFGFHPFLISLLPVLLLFQENVFEIPIEEIFTPLIISFVIIFITWIILIKFIERRKASVIISFFIVLLVILSYVRFTLISSDTVISLLFAKNIILIPIFLSIGIIGIIYILKKTISLNVTSIANVTSIVIVSVVIFQVGLFYVESYSLFDETQKLLDVPFFEVNEIKKPNVYFLVLDGYAGNIRLNNEYGYDNSGFYKQLEDRGFYVQQSSFSNYPHTEFSLPTMFNMQYFDSIAESKNEKFRNMLLLLELSKDNLVNQIFRANGYDIYSISEFRYSDFDHATNLCREKTIVSQDIINALYLKYIPVNSIRSMLLLSDDHYQIVTCSIDAMKNFEVEPDAPFFMYFHLVLPHPPFIFDADGNKIDAAYPFLPQFDNLNKDAYLEQLKFGSKIGIELIDSIKQKDSDAIIVIMSDHGDGIGNNLTEPTTRDYYGYFNNLSAMYFPNKESYFPIDVTPVNIFRVIFNLYFGTDYAILDDKLFWYEATKPFVHFDVTEKIQMASFQN